MFFAGQKNQYSPRLEVAWALCHSTTLLFDNLGDPGVTCKVSAVFLSLFFILSPVNSGVPVWLPRRSLVMYVYKYIF